MLTLVILVNLTTLMEILGDYLETFTMKFIPQLISIITHENLWTWQRAGNKIHGERKNKSKGASSWAGWLTFLTCVLNVSRR